MTSFVHLSVHTEFSIEDGLVKIRDLVKRTAELELPAVAITDRNLFGLVKFYDECHSLGIKPIIGTDVRFRNGSGDLHRCILIATTNEGYANLLRLTSAAFVSNKERGVVDRELIFQAASGLIALSGAREGDVGHSLLVGDAARAKVLVDDWTRVFGDRYYLEVQRTGRVEENEYLSQVVDLAVSQSLPVVATNDVRFVNRDDYEAHETRVCIQEGRTLNDPRRERRYSELQYIRSSKAMEEIFSDLPEALENSVEIAKRCNLNLKLGTYHLPNYPATNSESLEGFLDRSAREGLGVKLQSTSPPKDDAEEATYYQRLEYELDIVKQMGFAGYFLVVAEFVTWAKRKGIPVGPGRGSGSGSLVAFALGITDVDPLAYDLIFERFLNPERVSMPDFDIDFCMEGRDLVINHVAELYGQDAVSQIVTFGTMAAKAVVRDVARVQGKPYGLADKLSKMIPFEVGMTLANAVEQEVELRRFIDDNEEVAEIMDMAYKLEGVVRNVSKHAGGVVIAPSTLTNFVPLFSDDGSTGVVSQFDKDDVERVGLVKFDFLGLKTLTIIDWAVDAVNAKRLAKGEEPIAIDDISLEDPETYRLLREAETTAIFQLESEGMKELIRRLQPDSIDDIIALVALFRPGPLQSGAVDDYIDRKHGKSGVSYPHADLQPVLKNTYGVMLYQEHVMEVAQVLAGFSLGQADLLRRAMGKKKPEEMAEVREQFIDGALANGVKLPVASAIFDQMEKFAGYAFPKAHSTTYGIITFQTAWLKTHYPAEFMAAVVSADMQNIDKVVTLVDEVRRMGLTLRSPNINTSSFRFSADDGEILYGLGAVRGVGEGPVVAITEERSVRGPFKDLRDLCSRLDSKRVNKRVLEALVQSGAMDCFSFDKEDVDHARARFMVDLPVAVQVAEQTARDMEFGLHDMFGGAAQSDGHELGMLVSAWSKKDRLNGEKETLGLYFTGHPIDDYIDEIRNFCPTRIAALKVNRSSQVVAGLVVSNRTRRSRRGNSMAFTVLDDRSGRIEANIFGETYENNRAKLFKDAVLVLEGEVQPDEFSGRHKLKVDSIFTIDEARSRYADCLEISVESNSIDSRFSNRLRARLESHRDAIAGCMVVVSYIAASAQGRIVLGNGWRVAPTDDLLHDLREEFGRGHVTLRYGESG